MESVLTKNQKRKESVVFIENGKKYRADLEIRYDDECGNGHNTFSMTCELYQIHANGRKTSVGWGPANLAPAVMEHFPNFKKFLKWHLFNSNGPHAYISNTIYLAGNSDCWGRKKGKEREFDLARQAAFWPEASDEVLSLPKEDLKKVLEDRLPALIEEFKTDIESLGFVF